MKIDRFLSVLLVFLIALASFSNVKASVGTPRTDIVKFKIPSDEAKDPSVEKFVTSKVESDDVVVVAVKEEKSSHESKALCDQTYSADKLFVEVACYVFGQRMKALRAENIEIGYKVALNPDE